MNGGEVGFIGGGRIVSALLYRLTTCCWPLRGLCVSDADVTVRTSLLSRFSDLEVVRDNAVPASRRYVFLALHPKDVDETLAEIAPHLKEDAVLVSLVPSVTFAHLQALLGGFGRLARLMANAPSAVGAGYNPVCFAEGLDRKEREELQDLFSCFGAHPTVPESTLEGYTMLTALGPTYFWFQWQLLRELGHGFGLGAAETDAGLSAMLDGARRLMFDSGFGPDEVRELSSLTPLADAEPAIVASYRRELSALFAQFREAAKK